MLDYVINILDDTNDFFWASAKASHAVVLCLMEQGKITSSADTEKIDRVQRAHAKRHRVALQKCQIKAQVVPNHSLVFTLT